jgi:hypothetical protein
MGRYELEVAASAALVHCSISSSALVPPRCSLSLYYPVITLVHLPLKLLRSRAGAYSSNHRLLTRTSAHTYWAIPENTLGVCTRSLCTCTCTVTTPGTCTCTFCTRIQCVTSPMQSYSYSFFQKNRPLRPIHFFILLPTKGQCSF